jgi:hypothetical protein
MERTMKAQRLPHDVCLDYASAAASGTRDTRIEDPLTAARGIVYGLLLGAWLWLLVIMSIAALAI